MALQDSLDVERTRAGPSNVGAAVCSDPVEVDKDPARVRRMFGDIAGTYDFLNHLLSANRDKAWRRRTVRHLALTRGARVLDACTGTGDLALEAARHLTALGGGTVVGTDFCPEMLALAAAKAHGRQARSSRCAAVPVYLAVADTLRLPFADAAFDAATVGFGVRNLVDLPRGLRELHRVLRPAGSLAILEFTTPRWRWFRRLFELYFHRVLPRLGRWLSSAPDPDLDDAYRYLPSSVARFPRPEELARILERCGFEGVEHRRLGGGIVAVHTGTRGTAAPRAETR
jgi:demethylmenaquinone methyltransferase/2-methoxy-6-polyprenyl-1,4-benzoquinol methylase